MCDRTLCVQNWADAAMERQTGSECFDVVPGNASVVVGVSANASYDPNNVKSPSLLLLQLFASREVGPV